MFGHHIESGWADLDRAKQQQVNEFDPGPVEGPDGTPLQPGQCICGEFDCKDEYSHWTSGF
tara:strand:- start:471 stop:653 length:183 start_codon:yes stop_codon:yes gene_type:complete